MASLNEVYKLIGRAIIKGNYLDEGSSIAQGSNGTMYLRLNDQVFRIRVDELDQFDNVPDREGAVARFMATNPYPYEKNDPSTARQDAIMNLNKSLRSDET